MQSSKQITLFVLAGCIVIGTQATVVGQKSRDVEDRVQRLIRLSTAKRTTEQAITAFLREKPDPRITDRLAEEIYQRRAACITTQQSRQFAQQRIPTETRKELLNRLTTICQAKGLSPNDLNTVISEATIADAVRKHVRNVVNDQHATARARAVRKQLQHLSLEISIPEQSEVDAHLDTYVNLASYVESRRWDGYIAALSKSLAEKVTPSTATLFTENSDKLKEAAQQAARRIDTEYCNQKKVSRNWATDEKVPKDQITREQIRNFVMQKLAEHVAQKGREGVPSYGAFGIINRRIAGAATQLEARRFLEHIQNRRLSLAAETLREKVATSPGDHRTIANSISSFVKDNLKSESNVILNSYVNAHSESHSNADTLLGYFADLLAREDAFSKAMQRWLENELKKVVPRIHDEVAQQQFDAFFAKSLADWKPSEAEIVAIFRDEEPMPTKYDEAQGRYSVVASKQTQRLLEKTEELAFREVRLKLENGVSSVRRQLNFVDQIADEQASNLRKAVRDPKVNKEDIVAKWNQIFDQKWASNKGSSLYDDRLDATNRRLVQAVSELYVSLTQRTAQENAKQNTVTNSGKDSDLNDNDASHPTADAETISSTSEATGKTASSTAELRFGVPVEWARRGFKMGDSDGTGGGFEGEGTGSNKKDGRDGPGGDKKGQEELDLIVCVSDDGRECLATIKDDRTSVSFAPEDEDGAAATIADSVKRRLVEILKTKLANAPHSEKEHAIHLRFHLRIQSRKARAWLIPKMRAKLKAATMQWQKSVNVPKHVAVLLRWSDSYD